MTKSILSVVWLLCCLSLGDGAKVKRVKAGKHYKEHDDVHLVVNKVGYVPSRWGRIDSLFVPNVHLAAYCLRCLA
jgi:hypothetical protein